MNTRGKMALRCCSVVRTKLLVAIAAGLALMCPGWGGHSLVGIAEAKHQHGGDGLLYISSNNAAFGGNTVIAFRRSPTDGSLTMLGTFPTGGTGYKNTDQRLGPDDTDQELIASPDNQFLFVVNGGSDTISVFRINGNGKLILVGTPTLSGGNYPASLTLVGNRLYVVNRGNGILATEVSPNAVNGDRVRGTPGGTNYAGFTLNHNGGLTPIVDSTTPVLLTDGSSPSQTVASNDGKFLFGNDFFFPDPTVTPPKPVFPAARSLLDPLAIGSDGGLTLGTTAQLPAADNGAPYILGLRGHPTMNILYTGLVALGRLGVWTYNSTGNLTFFGEESDPNMIGAAGGMCWIAIDPSQKFLYTSSVIPNEVGVLAIAGTGSPTAPVRLQNLVLSGPSAPLPPGTPEPYEFTTAPFNIQVDPEDKFVYVLNSQTCTSNAVDPDCAMGSAIHFLKINSDGTLTEQTNSPMILPQSLVPDHPKGMVVF